MAVGDLQAMLRAMAPVLAEEAFGIVSVAELPQGVVPFATVAEAEGLTLVAPMAALHAAGLADGLAPWARISLTLHSDLEAVGLTAAFSKALGDQGISANVIAGFYHDHILVPWHQRAKAMAALSRLADV